ncbi:RagB/SusD family nutrient uptake outer membrane protein [Compostibacter hankyongensis]|uniref:RagB/SusD family nutrient uptake outer membrane protein n=1 Tax=Compostibacter hankyongensis TaxID=1007089 RepID=A0ABP8G1V5_9BACT
MKNIYLLLLLSAVLGIGACNKDLDIKPKSIVSSASMWETADDAEGAMYGMYAQLRNALSDNYAFWGDYRSGLFGDGIGSEGLLQNIFNNSLNRDDSGTDWSGLYKAINDCNLILKYTPEITFDNEKDKNLILANAYFVRALCYFYCARVWGDAPVVLSGFESDKQEDLYPSRSSRDSVYLQVAADIQQAVSLFPDDFTSAKSGSKAAANMLKADYYLWMYKTEDHKEDDLNKAKEAVDYVLADPDFTLLGSYQSVFSNDDNNEVIFALNFEQNEYTGGFPADFLVAVQYIQTQSLINNPIQVGSHQQWVCFTPDFEATLNEDPQDTRAKVNIAAFTDPGNNIHFRWINKYLGEWENGTRYFTSDIKIYRYAEAVLFKAEIENALGNSAEAISALNRIAKRAYQVDNYYASSLSKSDIDEAILTERLKEFAAEGKSWFDFIRFGVVFDRVATLHGQQDKQNILLWPVNASSINSNPKITQTPGYN